MDASDVVTTINGGGGDDTTIVGGDVTGAVISSSSQGSSSVTDNGVTSNDNPYNNIFAPGLGVTVGDASGGAIISQPSQSIVHVGDRARSRMLHGRARRRAGQRPDGLCRRDADFAVGRVGAAARGLAAGSIDGGQTWSSSAVLAFTNNGGVISGTQTVLMRAAPTTQFQLYPERNHRRCQHDLRHRRHSYRTRRSILSSCRWSRSRWRPARRP